MSAIEKARKTARKNYIVGIVFTLILYIIAWKLNQENKWEFSKNPISICFWAISVLCLVFSYMVIQFYILSKRVRELTLKDYLLWFKYDNGDELIIANRILIPYSKNVKKNTSLTGVSWGLENIKNAIDEMKEGSIPLSLMIPTIHFSSNKLPVFIPLIKLTGDRLYLYYVDTKDIKSLIIVINNEKVKTESLLNYPISKEIKFSLLDFNDLIDNLREKGMSFGSLHVTDEIIEKFKT